MATEVARAPRRYVLIPGLDGTGLLYDALRAALAPAPLYVLDYPTDRPLGYAALEAELAPRLPREDRYVLIGESFGGPLALALAARRPPGLAALALCATFVRLPAAFRAFAPFAAYAPTHLMSARLAAPVLLGRWSTPELEDALARALARVPAPVVRARLRAALEADAFAALRALDDVPMLYLRAARDRVIPASASRAILAARPATQLVEIDGPHFLLQAAAVQCAQALDRFASAA